MILKNTLMICFNTQPPEGGWAFAFCCFCGRTCFNTQPPEGGWRQPRRTHPPLRVSTHSRLKAAGAAIVVLPFRRLGFNTQPPEGGWGCAGTAIRRNGCFNTQPPEGGWLCPRSNRCRPPSFNTQPPEGGWVYIEQAAASRIVSTHSRLKAAGFHAVWIFSSKTGFNTQPPEGGWACRHSTKSSGDVSTHSRLKAAGLAKVRQTLNRKGFNTQPPEGGWVKFISETNTIPMFQHTAA